MSRNAFDIRLDVLRLSKDILTFNRSEDKYSQAINPQEIINIAKELYTFVENGSNKSEELSKKYREVFLDPNGKIVRK